MIREEIITHFEIKDFFGETERGRTIIIRIKKYDLNGKLIEEKSQSFWKEDESKSGIEAIEEKFEYSDNEEKLLILQKRVTYDYDKSRSETIITYEYNDDNQIIQETEKNDKEEISKIVKYEYELGLLRKKITENKSQYSSNSTTIYEYSTDNKLERTTTQKSGCLYSEDFYYYKDGELNKKVIYHYDKNGLREHEFIYSYFQGNKVKEIHYSRERGIESKSDIEYVDGKAINWKKLMASGEVEGNKTENTKYDDNGNWIEAFMYEHSDEKPKRIIKREIKYENTVANK